MNYKEIVSLEEHLQECDGELGEFIKVQNSGQYCKKCKKWVIKREK